MGEIIKTIPLEVLSGAGGSFKIIDTAVHDNLKVKTIIPSITTVIATLTLVDSAGVETDYKTSGNYTNLVAGIDQIIAGTNCYIKKIQLTSGTINCFS